MSEVWGGRVRSRSVAAERASRDRDGEAQREAGTVIRSLPQRTGRCLESDRVAE